jgi:hypothetical protein
LFGVVGHGFTRLENQDADKRHVNTERLHHQAALRWWSSQPDVWEWRLFDIQARRWRGSG